MSFFKQQQKKHSSFLYILIFFQCNGIQTFPINPKLSRIQTTNPMHIHPLRAWVSQIFILLVKQNRLQLPFCSQEGVAEPPSVSSISRLLRGSGRRDDPDGKKDYTIDGILGGKPFHKFRSVDVL